jgi:aryl-alcohol dehydrogenase-like predicted oxidoreductase
VHPIAALQSEYSLWTRNPEIAVLDACRTLGVTLVAFSPLGRGFLTATPPDVQSFDAKDIRRAMPRFVGGEWSRNLELHSQLLALAAEAGVTPAQLALAWLLSRGEDVLPIPGTRSVEHLIDDLGAADLQLDSSILGRADALVNQASVTGARYNAATQTEIDTEEFTA